MKFLRFTSLIIVLLWTGSLSAQSSGTVAPIEPCEILVPNTVGQDNNYMLQIQTTCAMDSFEFIVYNRWGQKLSTLHEQTELWDASELAAGTYYWILKAVIGEERRFDKGFVVLVK